MVTEPLTKKELLEKLTNNQIKDCLNNNILDCDLCTADTNEYYSEVIIEYLYNKKYLQDVNFIKNINNNNFYSGNYRVEYQEFVDHIKECFEINDLEKDLGRFIEFIDIIDNKVQLIKGKGYFITCKEESLEIFLVETKYRLYNESALRNCISFKKHIQNMDLENIIKSFIAEGKLPKKDYKINFAIIAKENKYPSMPAKEFRDKSRFQLQKIIKDFNLKIYYCYCKGR